MRIISMLKRQEWEKRTEAKIDVNRSDEFAGNFTHSDRENVV